MTRLSRLIHGPFDRRRDVPADETIEAGACPCRLCEERGVRHRTDGLTRVRQPPLDVLLRRRSDEPGQEHQMGRESPFYLMDLTGIGGGAGVRVDPDGLREDFK